MDIVSETGKRSHQSKSAELIARMVGKGANVNPDDPDAQEHPKSMLFAEQQFLQL